MKNKHYFSGSKIIFSLTFLNYVCMFTGMSVEVSLVEETTAGWRTPEKTTGPNPLHPMNVWNSKADFITDLRSNVYVELKH